MTARTRVAIDRAEITNERRIVVARPAAGQSSPAIAWSALAVGVIGAVANLAIRRREVAAPAVAQ